MSKCIFLCLAVVSLAGANDLRLGYSDGRSARIYNEIKEANPALWTRTDDVVVTAAGSNVITAIYVTDLRPDKDGIATIVNGGIGAKSVTIGLQSPSVLRGYRFEIEVFAADPNARLYNKGGAYMPYEDGQYPRKY